MYLFKISLTHSQYTRVLCISWFYYNQHALVRVTAVLINNIIKVLTVKKIIIDVFKEKMFLCRNEFSTEVLNWGPKN